MPEKALDTSPRIGLADVLLRDLSKRPGMMPLFGAEQEEVIVIERALAERRLAGERLQNIEALLACLAESYALHDKGEQSREALLEDVWAILKLIESQTRYDEAGMLSALLEVSR